MLRTLFFDLGNVLLFFDHEKMVRQIALLCSLEPEVIRKAMHLYGDAYERGAMTNQKIFTELSLLSQKSLCLEDLMEALGDIFEPNLPVIELALELKKRGHPLFLLSNTCDAHFKYALDHYPFLRQFDGYVLSYEAGARKPEKKIYEEALKIAGCKAEDCFYTDDIAEYITAARSLKIDAEQYTSPEELTQHFVQRGIL